MKTNILRLVFAFVGLMLMACVLSQSLAAQTIISFDSSPDNAMVMKIQNPDKADKPHKFIFIFDSASITYEFNTQGEVALYTTSFSGNTSASYPIPDGKHEIKYSIQVDENSVVSDHEVEEEEIEVENWMLRPKDWVN